jgi:hypothetical protein
MNCVSWWGKRRLRGQSADPSLNVLSMLALSSRPEFRPQPAPSGPASPGKQSKHNTESEPNVWPDRDLFAFFGKGSDFWRKDQISRERIRFPGKESDLMGKGSDFWGKIRFLGKGSDFWGKDQIFGERIRFCGGKSLLWSHTDEIIILRLSMKVLIVHFFPDRVPDSLNPVIINLFNRLPY